MSRRSAATAIALLLVGSLLHSTPRQALAAEPNELAAAEFLGDELGGAKGDFTLLYERTATVDRSGETLWVGKLVDERTGEVEIVYRDHGGVMGGPELLEGRQLAAEAPLSAVERKASEPLRAAVAAAAVEAAAVTEAPDTGATADAVEPGTLAVAVWLTADVAAAEAAVVSAHPETTWLGGRPVTNDLARVRELRAELWNARRAAFASAAEAFAAEVSLVGGSVGYASTSAPLVFVDLPPDSVALLAEDEAVVSMGLEGAWSPAMSVAGSAVEANWTTTSGDTGGGIRVGVVEYHNVRETGDMAGRVAAQWAVGGTIRYTGSGTFDHPTWVAGAIASQSSSYRGVAPGSLIVSAGTGGYTPSLTYDRRIIAAADWAISPSGGNADIVNTSLVQDTATGAEEARRFFDAISYYDGRLPISAAGNYVNFNGWQIGSPGTGYNVLTVGGVNDRGTASRSDDQIWYVPGSNGSNWLDRPNDPWNSHGDFNKPNLVAPAVGVRTANGLTATGTSVATPIVAGVAAQLLSGEPSLAIWPEAARAILMAGAVHRVRMPDGSYNADHEGVGMTSALWTSRVGNTGDGTYGGYRLGALDEDSHVVQSISIRPGDRLRVALAWSSHATSSTASDTLRADLDLRVTLPNGTVVGSYTIDNAYEFVEVTAPVGGTATLQILQSRFDASSERYGLAWAKVGDRTRPTVAAIHPKPQDAWVVPGERPQVRFSEAVTGVGEGTLTLRRTGTSSPLSANVTYSASSRTATLQPAAILAPGNYVLALKAGIADPALNALTPTSWTFTVKAPAGGFSSSVPSSPPMTMNAGTRVGYRFDGAGRVTASKSVTLGSAIAVSADRRATVTDVPGTWLRPTSGSLDGYWIRESSAARLPGQLSTQAFSPAQRVTFLAGTHFGYRFDSGGHTVASKSYTLAGSSSASATRRAVINGAWHLYVVNGVWSGYWLRESSKAYLPGARDLRDLTGALMNLKAGTHTGRSYAGDGRLLSSQTATLTKASKVTVSGYAVINGQPSFYVTSGTWAGYWVPESSSANIP